MNPRLKALLVTLILMVGALQHSVLGAGGDGQVESSAPAFTPANTAVLANWRDARFSQDFSALLKFLRLEWVILDSAAVPEAVRDKDLILVGGLEAAHSGELLRTVLTEEEIETVRAAWGPVVVEKESPWAAGRRLFVCAGADLIQTRDAAEEAIRRIIDRAPPASTWIRMRFEAPLYEGAGATVEHLRYTWDDEELQLADLEMEVGAKPRRSITAQQAAEDVERLFYLFSHGYSGYAFFDQNGDFSRAKASILDKLSTESRWSSSDLSRLLYEELDFIIDCHTEIGDYQYFGHADFWYDTEMELALGSDGYQFATDGVDHSLVSVNNRDPAAFLFPSLNAQGDPIYRLGTLSQTTPEPLLLEARGDAQEREFEVALERSDYDYYSEDYFREDAVGGVPVIRVRSFGDAIQDELTQFVRTGSAHRGDPVVIVDLRGNRGGNESWPVAWIQGLTGRRAESVFIFSELRSKTTMAGRANYFVQLQDFYPDNDLFQREASRHTILAEAYESEGRQPTWSGPSYPTMSPISNETTVVLITNRYVASAGEGMVMRASRAENVVLVGENTMGCLTFGNASLFQLPHSRLSVQLPINFGAYLDMTFREEIGIQPDLWVPAADAVNSAVAALRNGTITTYQPLSPDILGQPFVRERRWDIARWNGLIENMGIVLVTAAGAVWAYLMRKKPRVVWLTGFGWIGAAILLLVMHRENGIGFGFWLGGVVCLVWGGINRQRAKRDVPAD